MWELGRALWGSFMVLLSWGRPSPRCCKAGPLFLLLRNCFHCEFHVSGWALILFWPMGKQKEKLQVGGKGHLSLVESCRLCYNRSFLNVQPREEEHWDRWFSISIKVSSVIKSLPPLASTIWKGTVSPMRSTRKALPSWEARFQALRVPVLVRVVGMKAASESL